MTEDFLHYVWKMKLFSSADLTTTNSEYLTILHCGEHNQHAGPDFSNARIRIGETVWAGNIEIHIRSSDWLKHGHEKDEAYDNVILHVVYEDDEPVKNIPTLILKNRIDPALIDRYHFMMQTSGWIPCERHIRNVPEIIMKTWMSSLVIERLWEKTVSIEDRLRTNKGDWEETCYQLIAKNFGTNVNADPFARVARSLPYQIIRRHLNNPMQIEALLFGQAGFLQANFREVYPHQLQAEYEFLKKKYSLESIRILEWKFLRLRPANFPTVRMSQFAAFIAQHDKLFSAFLALKNIRDIKKMFSVTATDYWKEHYHFKKASPVKSASIGNDMIELIIINTVIPLLFLYGKINANESIVAQAVDLLGQLPAENNSVIAKWKEIGVGALHASDSQALLQLKTRYCNKKRCLSCQAGNKILRQEILKSEINT